MQLIVLTYKRTNSFTAVTFVLCQSVAYSLKHSQHKFPFVSPHSATSERSEFSLAAAAGRGDTTNLIVIC